MEQVSKKVLTFDEVVFYTGYSRSYLQKLTSGGIIPHSKPNGKAIFFDREKLEEWLLSNPKNGFKERQSAAANYISNTK
jgi:excisionase family DNA binding protein